MESSDRSADCVGPRNGLWHLLCEFAVLRSPHHLLMFGCSYPNHHGGASIVDLSSQSKNFAIFGPFRLAKEGRTEEAMEVLCALEDKSPDDPSVQQTFRGIQEAVAADKHGLADGPVIKRIFTGGPGQNFQRITLGVASQCLQQISGINLIT